MPIGDWAEALKVVRKHVVRISFQEGHGSGFQIVVGKIKNMEVEQDVVGIATAAHVIQRPLEWRLPIKITSENSPEDPIFLKPENRRILLNLERDGDAGLIVIQKANLRHLPDELPKLPPNLPAGVAARLFEGIEIGWCGYPGLLTPARLCFFSGRISAWLDNVQGYLVDGVAIHGVSGGPAFYIDEKNNPIIIGMVTDYIPNRATGEALPGVSLIRSLEPFLSLFKGHSTVTAYKEFSQD